MKKLMCIILLLVSQVRAEIPLNIIATSYDVIPPVPSCRILFHRQKEREKMIREAMYLQSIDSKDPVGQLMLRNQLITNKEFMDEELWSEERVKVHHIVNVESTLLNEVNKVGLENVYLSLNAVGAHWKGIVKFFPTDFDMEFNSSQSTFTLEYEIYLSSYCHETSEEPSLQLIPRKAPILAIPADDDHLLKEKLKLIGL